MPPADALALVQDAERRLWTPPGGKALDYLRQRGLTDATIRTARLGMTPPLDLPGRPRGITIPWFTDGERLALLKLRQPEGVKPKYRELSRDRPMIYPGADVIQPGRPLVVTEGELDALLLAQELGDLAAVVTLGSASARPDTDVLGSMLAAPVWHLASDADAAGDRAADGWPARARRVRPPAPCNDWTDVHQYGVNLRRWWSDRLRGIENPPLFTWPELSTWRWGPAIGDPEPGIIVCGPEEKPQTDEVAEALPPEFADDPGIRTLVGLIASRKADLRALAEHSRPCPGKWIEATVTSVAAPPAIVDDG
jgi:hypothetical protein